MTLWGMSYGHHDAAVVIISDNKIVETHRSRCRDLDDSMLKGLSFRDPPDLIYIHENKKRDLWRKIKSYDWGRLFVPKPYMDPHTKVKPIYGNHHLSHAATGYYTSGFRDALVVVADAVGELESLAVYKARDGRLDTQPIRVLRYPNSIGLFYSYHTALVGLTPNRDEHILMQMSEESSYVDYRIVLDTVTITDSLKFICDIDMHRYPKIVVTDPVVQKWIAATVQHTVERYFGLLIKHLAGPHGVNLVFTGGVAYNSKLCKMLKYHPSVKQLYVPSHPGDAGSALGAILQHTHQSIVLENGKIFNETP